MIAFVMMMCRRELPWGMPGRPTAWRAASGVAAVLIAVALLSGAAGCSDGDDEPERGHLEAAEPAWRPFVAAEYSRLNPREFAKVAKNPLVNEARRIIVFGEVPPAVRRDLPAALLAGGLQ